MKKYENILTFKAVREEYETPRIRKTMTVGELIEKLSSYDKNMKVYISNDNGYTYGGITESRINEEYEELDDDEEDEEE